MNTTILLEILSLTLLQSVLMIDNVIFISVLTDQLQPKPKLRARLIGVTASLILNTILILGAGFIMEYGHTEIFSVGGDKLKFDLHHSLMLFGGLFLIWKTAKEIRHKHDELTSKEVKKPESLTNTILTMIGVDLVFSIDSTLTAIGMSENRFVQITSVLCAVGLMFVFFTVINKFTTKYPSLKTLALCFLFLIGFNLLLEGFDKEIERGYTYFAMAFALFAEFIDISLTNRNIRIKKKLEEELKRQVDSK